MISARARAFVLGGIAIAAVSVLATLFAVRFSEDPGSSRLAGLPADPASAPVPKRSLYGSPGGVGVLTGDLAELRSRLERLEKEMADLRDELAATESRSRLGKALGPPTAEEFDGTYGPHVRRTIEGWSQERAWKQEEAYVMKRTVFWSEQFQLDEGTHHALFELLLDVRREAWDLETLWAPHGVKPMEGSEAYRAWLDGWRAILRRWAPEVLRLQVCTAEKSAKKIVLDMAPPELSPRLDL